MEHAWSDPYRIMNFDKGEYFEPGDCKMRGGLMNFSLQGTPTVWAVEQLLEGHWKGDRIAFVESYVHTEINYWRKYGKPSVRLDREIYENCTPYLNEDGLRAMDEIASEFGTTEIYNLPFEHIQPPFGHDINKRYILNGNKKLYCDLKMQHPQHVRYNEELDGIEIVSLHPLPLLLAAFDCGDKVSSYHGTCVTELGSWLPDMGHILVSDELPEGYRHLSTVFFDYEVSPFVAEHGGGRLDTIIGAYGEWPGKSMVSYWSPIYLDEGDIDTISKHLGD